jgi:signal transduction histidine kinase
MTTGRLRVLAIILPVGFWLALVLFRTLAFGEERSPVDDIFTLTAIALGAAAFSTWVFSIVDRQAAETRRHAVQLAALHEAALALTTELDLSLVLKKVVDLSRTLVGAQYAAVGVLEDNGQYIEQFITSGLAPEIRARMGELPRGHGLLGVLITEGKPIRIPDIQEDPRSVGFPPNHPPMRSLLGVPIQSKGRVIGDIYLTDKLVPLGEGTSTVALFTADDQAVVEMFATQAAIAIENAQLYRRTQQLAILQERQRFGMDLHDGIIQSIYAIGLMLEESDLCMESAPGEAHTIIRQGLRGLNDVIRDIRNYILDLRPQRFQGRDLPEGLEELARELRANTLLNIEIEAAEMDLTGLRPERTIELLHIAQEALTNAAKHARATHISVVLSRQNGNLVMRIGDNGLGFDLSAAQEKGGYGLRNMRERAAALNGDLQVESSAGHGTQITVQLPIEELEAKGAEQ